MSKVEVAGDNHTGVHCVSGVPFWWVCRMCPIACSGKAWTAFRRHECVAAFCQAINRATIYGGTFYAQSVASPTLIMLFI